MESFITTKLKKIRQQLLLQIYKFRHFEALK